jgi:hypothetical protein
MKNLLLTIISLAVLSSCKKKDAVDVYSPSIESFTINNSTTTSQQFMAGESVEFVFSIKDNDQLNKYELDIHPASDGHTHVGAGSTGGEYKLPVGQWSIWEEVMLNASTHSESKTYVIPDTISGIWHAVLTATDDSGLSSSRTFSLTIANDNAPVITILSTSPTIGVDGKIHTSPGGSIQINANAQDPDGLNYVSIKLFNGNGQLLNTSNVPATSNEVTFPANFSQATTGKYRIAIEARDLLGFKTIWDIPVIVQ